MNKIKDQLFCCPTETYTSEKIICASEVAESYYLKLPTVILKGMLARIFKRFHIQACQQYLMYYCYVLSKLT